MSILRFNPRPSTRRCACRGTATVEAVIVLPVFIILFISVFYIRNQVLSRQAAETKARTCAWAYSMKNCNELPAGCEGILRPGSSAGSVPSDVTQALGRSSNGFVETIINRVLEPVLSAAFGRSLDASTQLSYERPPLYGGGTATSKGSYHLACNLTPETPLDVAKDAWNTFIHSFLP